ncbi:MAG: DUF3108 domain-containing protein [Ottowia sp.]|nr:DUF3108 domain-containing protein [Ottowia sp.]
MPATAPLRPTAPWLRLVALVLIAHAVVLMSLPPRTAPTPGDPAVRYWATRVLAEPAPVARPDAAHPAPTGDAAHSADRMATQATQATPPLPHTPQAPRLAAAKPPPRAQRPATEAAPTQRPVRPNAAAAARPDRPAPAPNDSTANAPSTTAEPAPTPTHTQRSGAANALPNVALPAAASLHYAVSGTVRGLAYETQSKLLWQPADGRYQAEWLTQGDAQQRPRRWHSQGALSSTGLMPERFAETARSERAAHFDPTGGRIRFSANTADAEWAPGAQDRLSAVLQLAGLMAAAPALYPPGSTVTLHTANAREATAWVWTVQDDETLQIDGHAVPCAVLHHQPRNPYEPAVALWLAKPLGYLPARLRTSAAQGDSTDHRLQKLPPPR